VKFLSAPAKLLQVVEAVGIPFFAFKQAGAFAGNDATNPAVGQLNDLFAPPPIRYFVHNENDHPNDNTDQGHCDNCV